MAKEYMPVHYITEKIEIYNQFCFQKEECLTVIYVSKQNYTMNGDFLENYLSLFLKLKAVVSARAKSFNYATNIFYNLEYITYIGVGHGISFLKYFLYDAQETYGINQNDKLVLPPSDKLIYVAKKYGWEDYNIIKINLPRWEKYDNYKKETIREKVNSENNSIFIMFTWRDLKYKKIISPYYFKNIINLIDNHKLYKELLKKNITIYFSIHHLLDEYIYTPKIRIVIKISIKIIAILNLLIQIIFLIFLIFLDFALC